MGVRTHRPFEELPVADIGSGIAGSVAGIADLVAGIVGSVVIEAVAGIVAVAGSGMVADSGMAAGSGMAGSGIADHLADHLGNLPEDKGLDCEKEVSKRSFKP